MSENNILDFDTPYTTDLKIKKIEYHSYLYIPYTNSFNENDEICIYYCFRLGTTTEYYSAQE
jgi:hypothetical protein